MDVSEPRLRHRGFFLHSDTTGEPDTGEHENPEGFVVRSRTARPIARHQAGRVIRSSGRSGISARSDEERPQIRSGSVTGSRQRAHLPH